MKAQIISCAIVAIGTLLSLVGFSYSFIPSLTCRSPWVRVQMRDGSRSFKGGRGGGSGDVAFGRKDSRGASAGSKKPRLDQREGARQLTRAELKAKEIYDAMKVPQVQRMYAPQERVPLKDVQVGQKLRGRIIAVKE
jgi:hypothetical protein